MSLSRRRAQRPSTTRFRCLAAAALAATIAGVALTGAPAQAATSDTLASGQQLNPGQSISSGDGRYTTVMQTDGNLVEYGPNGAVWASGTNSGNGTVSVLQGDGNLVVVAPGNKPVWASGTSDGAGDRLVQQSDGNLVIYSVNNIPLWASQGGLTGRHQNLLASGGVLNSNQYILSPDGRYKVIMQTDGNLVEYGPAGALWASATSGGDGSVGSMQSDGNLVVIAPGNKPVWASNTSGSGARLVVQNDANLVVYSASGVALWASQTQQNTVNSAGSLAKANEGRTACGTNSLGGKGYGTSCTGNYGQPEWWCADFVKWVWGNSGDNVSGLTAAASSFNTYGNAHGTAHGVGYRLQPGDAVVFTSTGYSTIDHVGIVSSVSGGTAVIENGDFGGTSNNEATFAGSAKVVAYSMTATPTKGTKTTFGKTVYSVVSPTH